MDFSQIMKQAQEIQKSLQKLKKNMLGKSFKVFLVVAKFLY
ncbi:hypothetical protein NMD99_04995 [Wolbachia endosymbiont of Listronotus oregonensis]|nr:hypothetical protein NMD99_04995 [Wolbachia endosymbiont of Listronotus oregonensis]